MRTVSTMIYEIEELPEEGKRSALQFLFECAIVDKKDDSEITNAMLFELARAGDYEFYIDGTVYSEED